MPYYEKVSCRIAIQVCIGFFPDGRERHRTFSIRNIDPDAPLEPIEAVVRALAPILAYPITKVRKVVKRRIFFYEEAILPVPSLPVGAVRATHASYHETDAVERTLCVARDDRLPTRGGRHPRRPVFIPDPTRDAYPKGHRQGAPPAIIDRVVFSKRTETRARGGPAPPRCIRRRRRRLTSP